MREKFEMMRDWLSVLNKIYKGSGKRLLLIISIISCAMLIEAFSPLIGRKIFDEALVQKDYPLLIGLGITWILAVLLIAVFKYFSQLWSAKIELRACIDLNVIVARAYLLEFQTKEGRGKKHGERLSRILSDPPAFLTKAGLCSTLVAVASVLECVVLVVITIRLDWMLGLLCIVGAAVSIASQYRVPKAMTESYQKVSYSRAKVSAVVENILATWIPIIRHRAINEEVGGLNKHLEEKAAREYTAQKVQLAASMRNGILISFMPVALIWLGSYRMFNEAITLGTLVAFLNYMSIMNNSVRLVFGKSLQIFAGIGQAKDFMQVVLDTQKASSSSVEHKKVYSPSSIVFEKLFISVEEFTLEADHIAFEEGKTYLLRGNSGVGKTLFLEFLAGIKRAREGKVFINGRLCGFDEFSIMAKTFGYTRKEEILFDRPVYDNMVYNSNTTSVDELKSWVQILKMEDKLTRPAKDLSAGEKQRVGFIRELARKPKVFIIDEGLNSLDEELKVNLLKLIRESLPECILVICSHNWHQQFPIDEVIVISDGEIILGSVKNLSHISG